MRAMKSSGKWDDRAFEHRKQGFIFDQAIDLIYAEFLLRQELRESPSAQEYQQRFPLLAPIFSAKMSDE